MGEAYARQGVFASTFTYAFTKLRGKEWVANALLSGEGFPAAETFAELRRATSGEIQLSHNGTTSIGMARSLASRDFLKTSADVWVSFDDDHFAPSGTLHALIESARATRGLVACPALTRNGKSLNFRRHVGAWDAAQVVETPSQDPRGILLYPVFGIGMSCAAIHRSVIEALTDHPGAWVTNDPGEEPYPALFQDRLHRGRWVSEDIAFCMAMHESLLPRFVLLGHESAHAGAGCKLTERGELETDPGTAERISASRT